MTKHNFSHRYILIHYHCYGVTLGFVVAKDFDPNTITNKQMEKLAMLCGLDYDPKQGESISVFTMGPNEKFKEISKKQLRN